MRWVGMRWHRMRDGPGGVGWIGRGGTRRVGWSREGWAGWVIPHPTPPTTTCGQVAAVLGELPAGSIQPYNEGGALGGISAPGASAGLKP